MDRQAWGFLKYLGWKIWKQLQHEWVIRGIKGILSEVMNTLCHLNPGWWNKTYTSYAREIISIHVPSWWGMFLELKIIPPVSSLFSSDYNCKNTEWVVTMKRMEKIGAVYGKTCMGSNIVINSLTILPPNGGVYLASPGTESTCEFLDQNCTADLMLWQSGPLLEQRLATAS